MMNFDDTLEIYGILLGFMDKAFLLNYGPHDARIVPAFNVRDGANYIYIAEGAIVVTPKETIVTMEPMAFYVSSGVCDDGVYDPVADGIDAAVVAVNLHSGACMYYVLPGATFFVYEVRDRWPGSPVGPILPEPPSIRFDAAVVPTPLAVTIVGKPGSVSCYYMMPGTSLAASIHL